MEKKHQRINNKNEKVISAPHQKRRMRFEKIREFTRGGGIDIIEYRSIIEVE